MEIQPLADSRGFFARIRCEREFREHGLSTEIAQCNIGYSPRPGTLRGMHFQSAPHDECKLVRVSRGATRDVVIDLRVDSPTYCEWIGVDLGNGRPDMLYIPEGCAHGYQTVEPDTEVCYQTSAFYAPDSCGGVRYDDPVFGIDWPLPVTAISQADLDWPPYVRRDEPA